MDSPLQSLAAPRSSQHTCLRQSCGLGLSLLASLPLASRPEAEHRAPSQQADLSPYLMMLAAAFRSWVRSSGSCMTSSRKLITLHLSSSLVSKSCGEEGRVAVATVPAALGWSRPGQRRSLRVRLLPTAGCPSHSPLP